jgi:hypothetical protein
VPRAEKEDSPEKQGSQRKKVEKKSQGRRKSDDDDKEEKVYSHTAAEKEEKIVKQFVEEMLEDDSLPIPARPSEDWRPNDDVYGWVS